MKPIKRIIREIKKLIHPNPDVFLKSSKGIIHIGANQGQERYQYAKLKLPVIWIEPIDKVFTLLEKNIASFPNQRAFNCLITDLDDKNYDFHIANNEGASSSILDFGGHTEIWPEVHFTDTISIKSVSLPSFLKREKIDASLYDTLVIDTQGSELIILQGAESILPEFAFVKVEAPDFESYKGCCTDEQLGKFMTRIGFFEAARHKMDTGGSVRNYYDIVYENSSEKRS